VTSTPVHHYATPGPVAYRLEWKGLSFVYSGEGDLREGGRDKRESGVGKRSGGKGEGEGEEGRGGKGREGGGDGEEGGKGEEEEGEGVKVILNKTKDQYHHTDYRQVTI
jgi:hypothetical protein